MLMMPPRPLRPPTHLLQPGHSLARAKAMRGSIRGVSRLRQSARGLEDAFRRRSAGSDALEAYQLNEAIRRSTNEAIQDTLRRHPRPHVQRPEDDVLS